MKIDLNGPWKFKKQGNPETMKATVPGCVHTDLLDNGKIEDPHFRDNELQLMWIGESTWEYSRTFIVEEKLLEYDCVILKCLGLDTLASIKVNESLLGKTDNQFRVWEFDIKPYLEIGSNTLEICFESPFPRVNRAQEKRFLNQTGLGHHRIDGGNRIRKSPCNFGWDWGPMCITAGIWRTIEIVGCNDARLLDIQILQEHGKDQVLLKIVVETELFKELDLSTRIEMLKEGQQISVEESKITGRQTSLELLISSPCLWWPNGMGEQTLYQISIQLLKKNHVIDEQTKTIGLRRLFLETKDDQWGQSFQFVVNGKPFFAKGANWIPADTFVTRVTDEHYEFLVKSAADANMNMLRVWGGGIYENDSFYEFCDQYGICVWQDFMFACSAYPAFDAEFIESVGKEAEENIKRLRHHPSIALWCGNNELEQISEILLGEGVGKMTWEEYKFLFDDVLQSQVEQFDPQRNYWPSSPHSPIGNRLDHNNPSHGDAHLWDVWHGRKPFEWYRTCEHRFNSEFGFQSFPEPETVFSYTSEEDRNITSFVMEHHQRSPIGNSAIIDYMLSWFLMPKNFEMTLWLSQILQGMAMKYAVEHWRRSMPRGMGTLYWQLNDCWQGPSWSSIDFLGRWKALHYMARDFNAPLLVSAVENPDNLSADIFVTNDRLKAAEGELISTLFDTTGQLLHSESTRFQANAQESIQVSRIQHVTKVNSRCLLLRLELQENGQTTSTNVSFFERPKHLILKDPELKTSVQEEDDGSYTVTITAKSPALWVWPEYSGGDASFSNRFFHIFPDQPAACRIYPSQAADYEEFQKSIVVRSLWDTFSDSGSLSRMHS
ncbi:MAG: glycoside hydrolase family 2 protein [SAR324 cluster bacterium]|nr:glycoside hydrolase family 2 protein [SAR324 cluster bacterium]